MSQSQSSVRHHVRSFFKFHLKYVLIRFSFCCIALVAFSQIFSLSVASQRVGTRRGVRSTAQSDTDRVVLNAGTLFEGSLGARWDEYSDRSAATTAIESQPTAQLRISSQGASTDTPVEKRTTPSSFEPSSSQMVYSGVTGSEKLDVDIPLPPALDEESGLLDKENVSSAKESLLRATSGGVDSPLPGTKAGASPKALTKLPLVLDSFDYTVANIDPVYEPLLSRDITDFNGRWEVLPDKSESPEQLLKLLGFSSIKRRIMPRLKIVTQMAVVPKADQERLKQDAELEPFGADAFEKVTMLNFIPGGPVYAGELPLDGSVFDYHDKETGHWATRVRYENGRLAQRRESAKGVMYDVRAVLPKPPPGMADMEGPLMVFQWTLVLKDGQKVSVERWLRKHDGELSSREKKYAENEARRVRKQI